MSIKAGIVGYGYMGQRLEKMLRGIDGIDVVAVCDIDPSQLCYAGKEVRQYHAAQDLFHDQDVQVAIIVANNKEHKHLVMEAVRAGKNVICEKPAALSVKEFDEMLRCVDECGVKFTVHNQRRYDPDFRTLKTVFDSGTLGSPYVVKSSLYGFNGNMHDWHVYASEGGGMLYDWGVHLLDQILWMIPGKIISVYADIRNVINKEVDDYFQVMLKFDSGITAQIELGTYYLSDQKNWYTHHWFLGGTKGSAYINGFAPEGKIVRTKHLLENVAGVRTMTVNGPTRSFGTPEPGLIYTEELPYASTDRSDFFKDYVNYYYEPEKFLIKMPEVRRVLRLMETIRVSGRSNQSIAFET